jgi:capsular polysaccharide biosynthesis protein
MDELVAVHGAIGALGEKLQNVELAARKTRVVSLRHRQIANVRAHRVRLREDL